MSKCASEEKRDSEGKNSVRGGGDEGRKVSDEVADRLPDSPRL